MECDDNLKQIRKVQSFHVGLATQFQNKGGHVTGYDNEAILYSSDGNIRVGNKTKHRMDVEQKEDDH